MSGGIPSEQELALENASLAARVLECAAKRGATLGTAESCTGGLVAAALTDVPGSSQVFVGGVVSYWVQVKEALLDVDAALVEEHGVVSEEVACAMARGACRALSCDWALSSTGIAGPGGAEPGKPVGTVWLAFADGCQTRARCIHAPGNRQTVRLAAVNAALKLCLETVQQAS